jgi:FkbH-like protein
MVDPEDGYGTKLLRNKIKMVIWDLDDTFWNGTLAEGESVKRIARNVRIVKQLTDRGIVSSICSKNDYAAAKSVLERMGVWNYFVFPRISFDPKGEIVASIVEDANLRPDNVLFIDDNKLNLEEARHFSPALMTHLPEVIIPSLLDLPEAAGKADPTHAKLKQYKTLEKKQVDRQASAVGAASFLRGCDIRIHIDFNIEAHLERVVDLANKSNQLNFTKSRLETGQQVDEFKALLASYGSHAGVIRVWDKYGDYGIVGFFAMVRLPYKHDLKHFVFSCRTMNMGVEQFVFEYLGRPNVKIVEPVSNPIVAFESVDWIRMVETEEKEAGSLTTMGDLVFLGACQLLQLATMCSDRRTEFVNESRKGYIVQFDDAGFILGDIDRIRNDRVLEELGFWNAADKERFETSLQDAKQVILAPLGISSSWHYFKTAQGNLVRITQLNMKRVIDLRPAWFFNNFTYVKLETREDQLALMLDSLAYISSRTSRDCNIFVLGAVTGKEPPSAGHDGAPPGKARPARTPKAVIQWRSTVNRALLKYCSTNSKCHFVDVEKLVPPSEQYVAGHYTRRGFMAIRDAIIATLDPVRAGGQASDTGARLDSLERESRELRHEMRPIEQKPRAKGYFGLAKRTYSAFAKRDAASK